MRQLDLKHTADTWRCNIFLDKLILEYYYLNRR